MRERNGLERELSQLGLYEMQGEFNSSKTISPSFEWETPRGHSKQWQQAYKAAKPEDAAQHALVSQLALPVGKNETRKQAERVQAIRQLITHMYPSVAERMYNRLTSSEDALGQLFHQTLHPVTRKSLLDMLDVQQHMQKATAAPANASQQPQSAPTPSPVPTNDRDKKISDLWPQFKVRLPTTSPGITIDPKTLIIKSDPSDPHSWVWEALKEAANSLNIGISAAMMVLPPMIIAMMIEATWAKYYANPNNTPLWSQAGYMVEDMTRNLLVEILGGGPSEVVDLNFLPGISGGFPVVDLINRYGLISVKSSGLFPGTPGVLAPKHKQRYLLQLVGMMTDKNKPLDKLVTAVDLLVKNRKALEKVWPTALMNATEAEIHNYIRFEAPMALLHDHALLVAPHVEKELPAWIVKKRRHLAEELLGKNLRGVYRIEDMLIEDRKKLEDFAKKQAGRIKSIMMSSNDLLLFMEAAIKYVPKNHP